MKVRVPPQGYSGLVKLHYLPNSEKNEVKLVQRHLLFKGLQQTTNTRPLKRGLEVMVSDRLEIGIELVHQGYAIGDVELNDVAVRHLIQVFDQCANGVAVGHDQGLFTRFQGWRNGVVPKGQHARDGVFQAFRQGDQGGVNFCIALLVFFRSFIVMRQSRGRYVVAASPSQNLRVAIFFGRFGLVQALECAVMAFIQTPAVHHRKPWALHGI